MPESGYASRVNETQQPAQAQAPLYTYTRTGFEFRVYPNRIEVVDKSAFGAAFTGGARETILLRSVTDVGVDGLTHLTVTTQDGKRRKYLLGKDREDARQAIVAAL